MILKEEGGFYDPSDPDSDKPSDEDSILSEDGVQWANYSPMPNPLLRSKVLSNEAKLLYLHFVAYGGENGRIFPGRDRLISDLGVGKDTYYKALKELQENDLLVINRRGQGRTNTYLIRSWKAQKSFDKDKVMYLDKDIKKSAHKDTNKIQVNVDKEEPDEDIYTHETRSRASRTADASSTTSHPLKAKPVNVLVPALAQEKKSVSEEVVAKNTGHGKGAYSLFPEFKGIKTPAQRERQSPEESISEYKNMEPIHPSKNALRWYTQRFVQNFDCLPEVGNFPAAASRLKDLVTRHGAEVCERALTRFFADEKQRVRGYGWNNFVTCFESYRFETNGKAGTIKQTPMDKMYQAVDRINVIKNRGEL